jgi:hypothetical protein
LLIGLDLWVIRLFAAIGQLQQDNALSVPRSASDTSERVKRKKQHGVKQGMKLV